MKHEDAKKALLETNWDLDSLTALVIWAYDKGREDERKEPLCEWLSDRDIWELKDAKIFIEEELVRHAEDHMDAKFDWERTEEND